jgi:hypothetical protein
MVPIDQHGRFNLVLVSANKAILQRGNRAAGSTDEQYSILV